MKNLIIDGNSLLNRAFYALPILTNKKGEFLNAVYGFSNMLIKAIIDKKPDKVVVAFDYGKHTFRHDLYSDYKAGRHKTPEELVLQFPIIKQLLQEMQITFIELEGIEADDIIGSLTKTLNGNNIVLSGDKDLLQLVSDDTTLLLTQKGISQVNEVTPNNIKELFGYEASQVVDFKALRGDSSDNIPGVAGIGEKTAQDLLANFGSIDKIYENIDQINGKLKEKLILGEKSARLSKVLATIKTDCNLEKFEIADLHFPFTKNVKEKFEEFEFNSIIKRTELFEECIGDKTAEIEAVEIESVEQLKKVLAKVNGEFAIKPQGDVVEFSVNDGSVYKMQLDGLGVTFAMNCDIFEKIISSKNNTIICEDAKKLMYFLEKYAINSDFNYFDLSIAKYVASDLTDLEKCSVNDYYKLKKDYEEKFDELSLSDVFKNIDLPLAKVLFGMEKEGIKLDRAAFEKSKTIIEEKLDDVTNQIYELAGEEFNINSPKQLAVILFDKLGIYLPKKNRSTANDVLRQLENDHKIIPLIMEYRTINKLKTGYIDVYGNLLKTNSDSIIHTVFSQVVTATGRLSSSEPNLQNIPANKEDSDLIRSLFISKYDGGTIISADYNQIELRILAGLSADENMINAFKNDVDIHSLVASTIFSKPINEITQNERKKAKATNFGIVYGISDYGLSQQINSSVKDAKTIIDKYFESFPKIKSYLDDSIALAKENGYAQTKFGRRRFIPEINSPNYNLRSFGERVAMNMPIQGLASDIIKIAMINLYNSITNAKLKSKLVLQIHDELVVDVYPGEGEQIKKLLRQCMEDVAIDIKVKLLVKISEGKNLMELK